MNDEQTQKSKNEVDSHDTKSEDPSTLEPAVKDLEEAVTAYLRRATETFDLSKNVEVCKIKSFENEWNAKLQNCTLFCNGIFVQKLLDFKVENVFLV